MISPRPPNEAETCARLNARVGRADLRACDGCTACATRCTDAIDFTYPEFARLLAHVRRIPPAEVARILAQDKRYCWWEDVSIALCPFLDRETDRCIVYESRPLICRLFGVVSWLPCPTGRALRPRDDAVELMREYATLERRPLREWLALAGESIPGMAD